MLKNSKWRLLSIQLAWLWFKTTLHDNKIGYGWTISKMVLSALYWSTPSHAIHEAMPPRNNLLANNVPWKIPHKLGFANFIVCQIRQNFVKRDKNPIKIFPSLVLLHPKQQILRGLFGKKFWRKHDWLRSVERLLWAVSDA